MQKENNKNMYNIFKWILGIIFLIYYRPKFINKKAIPNKEPIIVCGNHIHLYDQCLPILSTNRMLHYMAKKEYFDSKMSWFFKLSGCIAVDRENHGGDSKDKAIEVLENGYALGIYPEGTRNNFKLKTEEVDRIFNLYVKNDKANFIKSIKKDILLSQVLFLEKLYINNKISKEDFINNICNVDSYLKSLVGSIITADEYKNSLILPLKFGVVSFAEKTNATIVPYAITGKYKLFNNKLKIEFGTPFKVNDMSLEDANLKLTNEICSLINK